MVVLIEGPDGSGKTTLCEAIVNQGDWVYHHCTRDDDRYPTTDSFYKEFNPWLSSVIRYGENVIIDRSFLTNIVYSKVFHDSNVISDKYLKELQSMIDVVVICIPDHDNYFNKFNHLRKERDELYDTMTDVYEEFSKIAYSETHENLLNGMKVVIYNIDQVPKENIGNFIKENILC